MQPVMWNLDKSFQQFYFAFVFRAVEPTHSEGKHSAVKWLKWERVEEVRIVTEECAKKRQLISMEKKKKIKNI